jgi:opacity protein-like surface antigen
MFPPVIHNAENVVKSMALHLQNRAAMKLYLVVAALLMASAAHAQTGVRPPQGWSLGFYVGGAAFTDFQRSNIRAVGFSIEGEPIERELPQSVGAQTSGVLAATLAYWPTQNWGFRARAAYAPTRFETVIPQSDADFLNMPRPAATGSEFRSLGITSYEGQVLFRLPTIRHRIMPYGIFGGGAVRYALGSGEEPIPEEAQSDFDSGAETRPAATLGLGAMIGLRPGWGLHFELVDQVSRTPVRGTQEDSRETTSSLTFMVGASWRAGS